MDKPCIEGQKHLIQAIETQDFESYQAHCQNCSLCQDDDVSEMWQAVQALPEIVPSDDFELRVMGAIAPKEPQTDWIDLVEKTLSILQIPAMALCVSLLLVNHTELQKNAPNTQIHYAQLIQQWAQTPISDSLKTLQEIYAHRRQQG